MVQQTVTAKTGSFQRSVSPYFLLRVGGLSINVVDDLRFQETSQWLEEVLTLESLLTGRKDKLIEILHEAVKRHMEHREFRRKLINLKRDVFNMRMPNDLDGVRLIADCLSSEESALFNQWLDLWDRYREKVATGPVVFMQELNAKRALLKKIVDIPDFRKGILLASPLLDQAIGAYIASNNFQPNREARTVERSLVEYLLRTACKTSPFSTFTPVCCGTFHEMETEHGRDFTYHFTGMEKRSFTRLNMAVLSRLSSLILSSDEVRGELPVQLTSGWQVQNNRIRYLRRKLDMEEVNEESPVVFDALHENVFYLPTGRLLNALLNLMRNGRKEKFSVIVSQLYHDIEHERTEEEISIYFQHLLRLGLLIVPDLQVDIHSKDPMADYSKGLRAITTQSTQRLADSLKQVELLVNSYPMVSVATRAGLLKDIKQQVKECYTELGDPEASGTRTLLYEDTTLNPQVLLFEKEGWRIILSEVAEFQRLLPIFDINLPRKLITKGYFRARYGLGQKCDDFLSFANEFNQDFFEYYRQKSMMRFLNALRGSPQHENHFKQPEIDALNYARQAVTDFVSKTYTSLLPGSTEMILGDDFLTTISSQLPQNTGEIQAHTFYSQFVRVSGEPLLVINRIYTGLTLMFSRFAHCFDEAESHQLVPALRSILEQCQSPGMVFAELKGSYDATNLNLHPAITPHELVCPGELSTRPSNEQIPLEDLYVQDDVRGDYLRLYSKRLDKEVIPLYLGFLLPIALPEIQQILLNFSYNTLCPLSLWGDKETLNREDMITFYPRIRYKHLVLQRAFWKIPPRLLPRRESGQSDVDFYLSLSRWRKENGLPTRVFITSEVSLPAATPRPGVDTKTERILPSNKPLYVDFENFFSVSLLEATIRASSNTFIMTEMLPHRDHLWFEHSGNSYVSEFVFEMNSLKGGYDE